ncbi:CLUMA_CG005634, isoform A [Clunio marinus]|uniref:CLUMA_CG005634, isoform A n=1 Tax=Clunio marinus TaxID=568069 RepID=A0A1J1HZT5_9DIPT|nr:CLUMA_CG005634, isoform A [Clunio marinus]
MFIRNLCNKTASHVKTTHICRFWNLTTYEITIARRLNKSKGSVQLNGRSKALKTTSRNPPTLVVVVIALHISQFTNSNVEM